MSLKQICHQFNHHGHRRVWFLRSMIAVCDPWAFHAKFDYIHIRAMYGSVADWFAFYAEVFKCVWSCRCIRWRDKVLKPGGYVEHMEVAVVPSSFDRTTDSTIFDKWGQVSVDAGEALGKTLRVVDMRANLMRKAGFENVTEHLLPLLLGSWPKDKQLKLIGTLNRDQIEQSLGGCVWMLSIQYLKYGSLRSKWEFIRMRWKWSANFEHSSLTRCVSLFLVQSCADTIRTISYARKPLAWIETSNVIVVEVDWGFNGWTESYTHSTAFLETFRMILIRVALVGSPPMLAGLGISWIAR